MVKTDPRVKLLFIFLFSSLSLLFNNIIGIISLTIFVFINSLFLGLDFKLLKNRLFRFLPLLFGISIIQLIFVRSGDEVLVVNNFVLIYYDGLVRSVNVGFRFIILIISASIMAIENNRKIIASFSKLKIPYLFSFMIMLALKFIPFFQDSFKDALVAIQLRGIDLKNVENKKKIQLFSSILLPIVVDAVYKSKGLAISMTSKGFNASKTRTYYIDVKLNIIDYLFMLFYLCCFSLFIYFNL